MTPDASLAAVILAVTDGEPRLLAVDRDGVGALPSGPLPDTTPTLEIGLRGWVREQTGFELGYVEQLYTFGDLRRGPAAEGRHLSIAYLALVREAATAPGARWVDVYELFPWEDRRDDNGTAVTDRLRAWAADDPDRLHRVRIAFGLDGAPWDGIRCLDRYELLYESGSVAEYHRDRAATAPDDVPGSTPMATDHRRIAATALARMRGKLTYRPVVFELLPEEFTLRTLQTVVEALAGERLHTQNFRRLVESGGLVESTGRQDASTGGRPATLYRFRADVLLERPRPGVGRPSAWG